MWEAYRPVGDSDSHNYSHSRNHGRTETATDLLNTGGADAGTDMDATRHTNLALCSCC